MQVDPTFRVGNPRSPQTEDSFNILIGLRTGTTLTTGKRNILIGDNLEPPTPDTSDLFIISEVMPTLHPFFLYEILDHMRNVYRLIQDHYRKVLSPERFEQLETWLKRFNIHLLDQFEKLAGRSFQDTQYLISSYSSNWRTNRFLLDNYVGPIKDLTLDLYWIPVPPLTSATIFIDFIEMSEIEMEGKGHHGILVKFRGTERYEKVRKYLEAQVKEEMIKYREMGDLDVEGIFRDSSDLQLLE